MLDILKNEYFLYLVDLNDAVDFPLVVVLVGIEVGGEGDFVEEEVDLLGRQGLLWQLGLEDWLYEGPEHHFVYY